MNTPQRTSKTLNPALRLSLLGCGVIATVLGVIGIFLPLLPTVPFLLLALACFARSSETFYNWLLDHAHFGPLVRPYVDGRGMPRASKLKAIALVWASIIFSAFFLVENVSLKWLLLIVACGVTAYLIHLPVMEVDDEDDIP